MRIRLSPTQPVRSSQSTTSSPDKRVPLSPAQASLQTRHQAPPRSPHSRKHAHRSSQSLPRAQGSPQTPRRLSRATSSAPSPHFLKLPELAEQRDLLTQPP